LLYGVTSRDPLTFTSVVALLVLVALGASWLPAWRATRVDPLTALRAD
jgi:putative ABC transport system permease protein